MSPVSIVLDESSAVWYRRLPEVEASMMPIQPTVPHDDVHCGNVQSALDTDTPLLGAANVTDVRAYEPPDTSVPVLASVGSLVYKAT
jgi:hypothetical protein